MAYLEFIALAANIIEVISFPFAVIATVVGFNSWRLARKKKPDEGNSRKDDKEE